MLKRLIICIFRKFFEVKTAYATNAKRYKPGKIYVTESSGKCVVVANKDDDHFYFVQLKTN